MIAVDTNLLIYAHRRDSEFHKEAAELVRSLAEGRKPWAIPWPCVHEFLAIATHPRIYDPPSTLEEAFRQVDAWFEAPTLTFLGEIPSHWMLLRSLLVEVRLVGPKIHDARIATLCLSHGVTELWSADRDFSRFNRLKVRNPLV